MLFSVIYSVDSAGRGPIRPLLPPQRHLFQQTEDDSCYEYRYLGGRWSTGRHRKLCALLTKAQFEQFILDTPLLAQECETLGSLGAPGFGVGLSPAISFDYQDEDVILSAYVTPIPEVLVRTEIPGETAREEKVWMMRDDRDWQRLKAAILRRWR